MRKPAAFAAAGMSSPSAHDAWCGSPQAICTTPTPRRSMNCFNSGTLVTCSDQLQTPISSGEMAIDSSPWCGFDGDGQWAEFFPVALADFVEGRHLFGLQFRDLLRPGPDDGPPLRMRFEHELYRGFELHA